MVSSEKNNNKINQLPADLHETKSGADRVLKFMQRHENKLAAAAFVASGLAMLGAGHRGIEHSRAEVAASSATYRGESPEQVEAARQQAKENWTVVDTAKGLADTLRTDRMIIPGNFPEEGAEFKRVIMEDQLTQAATGFNILTDTTIAAGLVRRRFKNFSDKNKKTDEITT